MKDGSTNSCLQLLHFIAPRLNRGLCPAAGEDVPVYNKCFALTSRY